MHAGPMSNTSTHTNIATTDPPRDLFDRAIAVAAPIVDGTRPDQLRLGTPCADFDVEQLLGHLVFALERLATVGAGGELGLADEVVSSDDWSADFRAVATRVRGAWSDEQRLIDTVVLPWASMTGAEALGVYVNEVTTHTWDLAQATGQTVPWDDDVVARGARRDRAAAADRRPRPDLAVVPRRSADRGHGRFLAALRECGRCVRQRSVDRPPGGLERPPPLRPLTRARQRVPTSESAPAAARPRAKTSISSAGIGCAKK